MDTGAINISIILWEIILGKVIFADSDLSLLIEIITIWYNEKSFQIIIESNIKSKLNKKLVDWFKEFFEQLWCMSWIYQDYFKDMLQSVN